MPILPGEKLRGSITKGEEIVYENAAIETFSYEEGRTAGKDAVCFYIQSEEEPTLKMQEKCRLKLSNGEEREVRVMHVSEVGDKLFYSVGFYFQGPYSADESE